MHARSCTRNMHWSRYPAPNATARYCNLPLSPASPSRYMHWSGELRCRVTTVTRRWIEGSGMAELITGGGEGAACGVV